MMTIPLRLFAVAAMLSLTTTSEAQRARPAPRPSTQAPRPAGAPPIVLPFPPLMAPPTGGLTPTPPLVPSSSPGAPRDLYRVDSRSNPGKAGRPSALPGGYPGYGGYPFAADPSAPAPQLPIATASGSLRLSVTPASAQVFVDSYYVGTVEDLDGRRGLRVPVGPHRLEIRAPDHRDLIVDVRIDPNETTTYQGALERLPQPEPRKPASASASRMYVIPNCYLGNIPPRADRLPPGCNIQKVRIVGGP